MRTLKALEEMVPGLRHDRRGGRGMLGTGLGLGLCLLGIGWLWCGLMLLWVGSFSKECLLEVCCFFPSGRDSGR